MSKENYQWEISEWDDMSLEEKADANRALILRLHRSSRLKWRLLIFWIIAFTVTAVLMFTANRHRIKDIQQSRVLSCQQNYEGQRKLFDKFRPKKDDPSTPRNEIADFKKFDEEIDRLKRQCVVQVSTDNRVKTTTLPSATHTQSTAAH